MEKMSEPESTISKTYQKTCCARSIFSYIDDLDSTSLVCKLFCSLSSLLVHKLTLDNSHLTLTYLDFRRLLKRFTGVKTICIDDLHKLDNALMAISNSGLNLEKLQLPWRVQYPKPQTIENMSTSRVIKGIKSLQLGLCDGTSKKHVIEYVNLFSSLTELDIKNCSQWNDRVIHEVTSNLPNLQMISLSNNDFKAMTDKTLSILSSNCPKLESVRFIGCKFTPEAFYKFFCNNQLRSVYMLGFYSHSMVGCMKVLKHLNHLSLQSDIVRDAILIAIAESRPPLKYLLIGHSESRKYTMAGLSQLLSACPNLESLDIRLPCYDSENCKTHDADMSIVVKRLPNLKHIKVWSRYVVCRATLFSLVQNCPLLETIRLTRDSCYPLYCDRGMSTPTKKNYSIKLIEIRPENSDIWYRSRVEPYCPNLRKYFKDL